MRERKPFYKKSHKCWYFKHHGRDVRLDPDETKARELWHQIVGGTRDVTKDTTVHDLMIRFLDWSKQHNALSTYEQYKYHLKSFHGSIGSLRFASLKQHHVTRWLDSRYTAETSPSTIHTAVKSVQRMLNWNKRQGWVQEVPRFEKPTPLPRDAYLMPEEYEQVIALIEDQEFLDFAITLRETGCRPLEARKVEARHFKGDRWEFTAADAKGGLEARVVLLNDKALEITKRLVKEHPEGPLFLNMRGRPWTKDALSCRCYRLRQQIDFPVCCYAIRHTFATDAIIRGVDLISIRILMGHKDLRMLNRVYQHVMKRSEHMKEALRIATSDDSRKAG